MSAPAPTASADHASTASRAAAHPLQAKLSVGRSHDGFEQEADRAAAAVVGHGPSPAAQTGAAAGVQRRAAPKISRLKDQAVRRQETGVGAHGVRPPDFQRKEEEEPQEKLQRKTGVGAHGVRPPDFQRKEEEEPQEKLQRKKETEPRANVRDKRQFPVLDRVEDKLFESKGKGQPLPDETRMEMETGFRADFGGVRIHTGADAEGMSRELRAQAFTHGKDVFFNAGKFEPDTVRGKTLLAHELTHVVQQGAAEQKVPQERVEKNNAQRQQPPPEPADKKAMEVETATEKRLEQSAPAPGAPPPAAPGAAAPATPAPGEKAAPAEGEAAEASKAEEPKAKGKKKGKAKRGAGKPPAAAKGGGVGAFLRRSTRAVFAAKTAGVAELAANEKKKDPAEAKLAQTEKAVVPPAEEGASKSKAKQVEIVEQAPEPKPDEAKAKQEFDAALERAVPRTLEEVDEFKEAGKGRVVGQAAKEVVTADAQEVQGTYQEIDKPPAPEPPAQEPEELPEVEAATETEALGLGDGVVGEVQPEHTDLSEFDQQSDSLLEQEEIKEEHLEMVDEGDLAEANKERKTLKTTVKEGPREVKALEQQEKLKVRKDLQKEEQQGRRQMREERQQELEGARGEQQKTKSKIELKRQEVTDHVNGLYETANATVKQKLEDLEKSSLKAFDDGEKQATKAFEDNVKRRIDAFKRRRYDRFGGSLLWAKDKLFGMDELPEVEEIFESEKTAFVTSLDALIKKITADSKRVVQECKDIVAKARKEIEKYVAGLGPELRKTGQEALTEMRGKLDALDKKVGDKEKELQKKLADKREAAIKAIEEKIEKMKEEMSGLLAKLGNLILNAMLKFFKWALKKAGYSPDEIMGIIEKGKAVIKKIVTDPIGFIKNLVKGVKDGIFLFVKNVKKHLVTGLVSWLTGAMADVPITLPDKWDLKGIIHLVLQILGLTWERIRQKLVKRLGEKVVRIAETSIDVVKRLITEGPMALWDMIKEKAADIQQQVMEGIRNWVITQVVKQAIIKLVSFLNPAGAIVQAILAIYNTIMFFVENWQRIVDFVKSVFDSIGDVAMGKLSKAAQAVENALAMTIPIILNFLARLIGLSGIGKAVAGVITKIRKPVDKVVDKVIDFVVAKGKKLLGKISPKSKKKAETEGDLDADDRKNHKKIVVAASSELRKPLSKRPVDFAAFYNAKKQVAAGLEKKYQSKIRKGIELRIEFKPLEKEMTDKDLDIKISIKPNDETALIEIPDPSAGGGEPMIPLFRGIHFMDRDPKKHRDLLKVSSVGKATPSRAALTKAGLATFSDADRNQSATEQGIRVIREELEKGKTGPEVAAWWKTQKGRAPFDGPLHALLQRFINSYGAFEKELNKGIEGVDLSFTEIPFISSSAAARHPLKYALGGKFKAKEIPTDKRRRIVDKVGRVFIYVFGKSEIEKEGGIKIPDAAKDQKVLIKPRILHEQEVTFLGGISGKFLKKQKDIQWRKKPYYNVTSANANEDKFFDKVAREAEKQAPDVENEGREEALKEFEGRRKSAAT
ncbi:MAG TPA: DUF4157 domain-containing protein [Thermoanaerobaculia bacterium]